MFILFYSSNIFKIKSIKIFPLIYLSKSTSQYSMLNNINNINLTLHKRLCYFYHKFIINIKVH